MISIDIQVEFHNWCHKGRECKTSIHLHSLIKQFHKDSLIHLAFNKGYEE